MQQDTDQADPLKDARREFSRPVNEIKAGLLAASEPRPKWTQDKAIAFECAREIITDMMAFQTGQIAEETHKSIPNADSLTSLRLERSRLSQERAALHVDDLTEVARIRTEYGAVIRARREENHTFSA